MSKDTQKILFVALGDIVKIIKGKKPSSLTNENKPGLIPYIDIEAFENGILKRFTDPVKAVICEDDDVLIVWDGSRSGFVGRGTKGALGSTLAKIHIPYIERTYLFYYLQSIYHVLNSRAKGVGIPHVNPDLLKSLFFPLVSRAQQLKVITKIEELFSELDAGVKELKAAQEKLKQYRASVLAAACSGKLVPTEAELAKAEGRSYESGVELLERILKERREKWNGRGKYKEPILPDASNLPELPEGWVWATIDMIAEAKLGKMLSDKARDTNLLHLPYLRNENVRWGRIDITDTHQMGFKRDEAERYSVTLGDLLICEGGEPGRCAVYSHPKTFMYQKALHRVRFFGELISPHYAAACLELYTKWKQDMLPSMSQTTIKHLPLEKLLQVSLPIPPFNEQGRIVKEIEKYQSLIEKNHMALSDDINHIERLRQSILQQAFSGKLVPQDENDEPASALLERIKAEQANTASKKSSKKSAHSNTVTE